MYEILKDFVQNFLSSNFNKLKSKKKKIYWSKATLFELISLFKIIILSNNLMTADYKKNNRNFFNLEAKFNTDKCNKQEFSLGLEKLII